MVDMATKYVKQSFEVLWLYWNRANHRRNNHRDRGRLVPQLLGRGDQQCIGPSNFLAVVFKKQEISQQVVIRMQDLASEFTKISRGDTPGPSQREGATPFRTQHPASLWPGAERKRPGVGTQTLVPSTF